jgi:hypothetical protein
VISFLWASGDTGPFVTMYSKSGISRRHCEEACESLFRRAHAFFSVVRIAG